MHIDRYHTPQRILHYYLFNQNHSFYLHHLVPYRPEIEQHLPCRWAAAVVSFSLIHLLEDIISLKLMNVSNRGSGNISDTLHSLTDKLCSFISQELAEGRMFPL